MIFYLIGKFIKIVGIYDHNLFITLTDDQSRWN